MNCRPSTNRHPGWARSINAFSSYYSPWFSLAPSRRARWGHRPDFVAALRPSTDPARGGRRRRRRADAPASAFPPPRPHSNLLHPSSPVCRPSVVRPSPGRGLCRGYWIDWQLAQAITLLSAVTRRQTRLDDLWPVQTPARPDKCGEK